MREMRSKIRLGTQGWNYSAWSGPFYPDGTRPAEYLSVYARAFDTVEVDSTFYAVPASRTVRDWAARTPPGFQFSLKLPQEITHENGFRGSEGITKLFFERALELGDKLGAVLIQTGPGFGPTGLPALAAYLPTLPSREVNIAIEFRQRGWIHDGVLALLAEHRIALALVDSRWIARKTMQGLAERPTADFAYLRWMGPDRDIVDYSRIQFDRTRELESWAGIVEALAKRVKTVYGYVNNHFAGHSPATVRQLQELLGIRSVSPSELGDQLSFL
jgi:uncharacterized protein YecE (DUF72 family)